MKIKKSPKPVVRQRKMLAAYKRVVVLLAPLNQVERSRVLKASAATLGV